MVSAQWIWDVLSINSQIHYEKWLSIILTLKNPIIFAELLYTDYASYALSTTLKSHAEHKTVRRGAYQTIFKPCFHGEKQETKENHQK